MAPGTSSAAVPAKPSPVELFVTGSRIGESAQMGLLALLLVEQTKNERLPVGALFGLMSAPGIHHTLPGN